MIYALLVWQVLNVLASLVVVVRSKDSAESLAHLINAAVHAVFLVYVAGVAL
ncbi:hypothetical protein SMC26_39515 [Actinomadura fulvescens]|uniref:Uncharacterized protein n=1 Tax=Actinomadura fulvescens TaxID=46160 RepID=A0ABN3PZC7_9ACTN